jgi:carbamoyl-phosphate synthase large subunit
MSILVTGIGGGVGQSILKSLAGTDYKVIGVDSSPLAAGHFFGNKSYLGLAASHADYIPRLLEICKIEDVTHIFPGHDIELLPLSKNSDVFKEFGITPIVSELRVIQICDDKLSTSQFLRENNFETPATREFSEFIWNGVPVILKPQKGGARSKHTYLARTISEFTKYSQMVDQNNCVIQEFIDGDEYTAGTISLDDEYFGSILMRRILRDGDTYKAFSVHDSSVQDELQRIILKLKPYGACNVQFRIRDDKVYVFELNARCSGTTAARSLVGFNEPKIILDKLIKNLKPNLEYFDATILRYWNEVLVSNHEIEDLGKS